MANNAELQNIIRDIKNLKKAEKHFKYKMDHEATKDSNWGSMELTMFTCGLELKSQYFRLTGKKYEEE